MRKQMIIDPPLLNTASPWATSFLDLQTLYNCEFTGGITTRTSMLDGFQHDEEVHQHLFFDVGSGPTISSSAAAVDLVSSVNAEEGKEGKGKGARSSLNTYGYSPFPLSEYIGFIRRLETTKKKKEGQEGKLIVVSVTGRPDDIARAYALLVELARSRRDLRLGMEINLSCPNINDKPPPAYDGGSLREYLDELRKRVVGSGGAGAGGDADVKIGIKLPPYTWRGQFDMVVETIRSATIPVAFDYDDEREQGNNGAVQEQEQKSVLDFVTSTNTLGSSLVLSSFSDRSSDVDSGSNVYRPSLKSSTTGDLSGIGGLAGAAIHPLSLGNVRTLRTLFDQYASTKHLLIIGAGGVGDRAGFERMRCVGADAVGVASALGMDGVGVFEKILNG